jgi:dephospho-CoA kinase
MIRAGLTGGIATGKSTAAGILAEAGIPVIDADQVSREVVARGQPALSAIIARFGREVLNPQGTLNREALGAIVFSDPQARKDLEKITHPRIRERVEGWLQAQSSRHAAVVEAALLVETGSYKEYDLLIVIECSEPVQLKRLMERSQLTEAAARRWLAAQLALTEKAALADVLINNDGDRQALRAQLLSLIERLSGRS